MFNVFLSKKCVPAKPDGDNIFSDMVMDTNTTDAYDDNSKATGDRVVDMNEDVEDSNTSIMSIESAVGVSYFISYQKFTFANSTMLHIYSYSRLHHCSEPLQQALRGRSYRIPYCPKAQHTNLCNLHQSNQK